LRSDILHTNPWRIEITSIKLCLFKKKKNRSGVVNKVLIKIFGSQIVPCQIYCSHSMNICLLATLKNRSKIFSGIFKLEFKYFLNQNFHVAAIVNSAELFWWKSVRNLSVRLYVVNFSHFQLPANPCMPTHQTDHNCSSRVLKKCCIFLKRLEIEIEDDGPGLRLGKTFFISPEKLHA
jgi:hypothetical protein